jgi:hypothetical protein
MQCTSKSQVVEIQPEESKMSERAFIIGAFALGLVAAVYIFLFGYFLARATLAH